LPFPEWGINFMAEPSLEQTKKNIHAAFDSLVDGLKDSVKDISALEVNTMIVSDISGLKFKPLLSYEALYRIPHKDLPENIIKDSDDYYDDLYKGNLEYPSLNGSNTKISSKDLNIARKNHLKLRERLGEAAKLATNNQDYQLPDPESVEDRPELHNLLENTQFIRSLRKLNELRSLAEKPEASDSSNVFDNIYAQTTIQLDGDIVNCFHKRLFESMEGDDRDFLIKVHLDAVNSGQKNWQSLLHLIFDMLSQIPKLINPNRSTNI
jgi:hypothetical protein